MKVLDLFSGIGGFSLAASWIGHETVGFVEIDPWCRRVLEKHWPGIPQHDDIRTFGKKEIDGLGNIDIITGGFPCQPFSTAGKRRGTDDDRHLWPEMLRVIDIVRPRYVLGENVDHFVNMAYDTSAADLEAIGYEVGAFIVPAIGVGANHIRHRTWIMAHANGERLEGFGAERELREDCQEGEVVWGSHDGRAETMAYATGERQSGPGPCGDAIHRQEEGEGEATEPVDGRFRSEWITEPGVGRVAYGVSRRVDRLRGLGNAIVPQVAYEILKVMTDA